MSRDDNKTAETDWPEPPMFQPDPDLIYHLEGNKRELRRYREHARRSAEEARREWERIHPTAESGQPGS